MMLLGKIAIIGACSEDRAMVREALEKVEGAEYGILNNHIEVIESEKNMFGAYIGLTAGLMSDYQHFISEMPLRDHPTPQKCNQRKIRKQKRRGGKHGKR